jgi:hypothetical protein
MRQPSDTDALPNDAPAADRWAALYRAGAIAALLIAVLLVAEVAVYAAWPRPESAREHLELFQRDRLIGLLTLDLLGIVAYVLFVPVMLALYLALHRQAEGTMLIGTSLFFVGVSVFLATNTALPVLALSARYGASAVEADRVAALGAAEAMFAIFNETAFLTSYVLVSAAWAMVGGGMLRSRRFGRPAAYAGILAGLAGIVAVVFEHASADLVAVAIPMYFAAIVLLIGWVSLTGRALWRVRLTL